MLRTNLTHNVSQRWTKKIRNKKMNEFFYIYLIEKAIDKFLSKCWIKLRWQNKSFSEKGSYENKYA